MPDSGLDQLPAPDPQASHRLYQFGLGAFVLTFAWFLYQTGGDVSLHTLIGFVILLLACLPALNWARHVRPWFPAFEISLLSCTAFYAFPLLSNHEELAHYPESVVNEAGLLVVYYLLAANFGFSLLRNPARAPRWAVESLLPDGAHRYVAAGMALNTIYLYVDQFTGLIPVSFTGTIRALFFGVGIISTFVFARLWGLEKLNSRQIGPACIQLAIQVILLFSQLYLITGISLLTLALIGYASARRQVPWITVAIILPIIALLHLGKPDMRQHYWEEKASAPTLLQLPAYFTEWASYSVDALRKPKNAAEDNRSSIIERASLIHMLCLSVDRVPSIRPYLNGASYVDIPAQIVPRFFWPDKPSSLLANVRLALHFNLIDPDSPFTVSIAFGVISEAYINFGTIGVIGLGFLFGLIFKRITLLAHSAPQFSVLGIFMVLLTAWSFQAELVLATWLSSLFQATVVCVGLPLVYQRFTTR